MLGFEANSPLSIPSVSSVVAGVVSTIVGVGVSIAISVAAVVVLSIRNCDEGEDGKESEEKNTEFVHFSG